MKTVSPDNVLTKCVMKASRFRSHHFHVISVRVLINHDKRRTSRRLASCFVCILSHCTDYPIHSQLYIKH